LNGFNRIEFNYLDSPIRKRFKKIAGCCNCLSVINKVYLYTLDGFAVQNRQIYVPLRHAFNDKGFKVDMVFGILYWRFEHCGIGRLSICNQSDFVPSSAGFRWPFYHAAVKRFQNVLSGSDRISSAVPWWPCFLGRQQSSGWTIWWGFSVVGASSIVSETFGKVAHPLLSSRWKLIVGQKSDAYTIVIRCFPSKK